MYFIKPTLSKIVKLVKTFTHDAMVTICIYKNQDYVIYVEEME